MKTVVAINCTYHIFLTRNILTPRRFFEQIVFFYFPNLKNLHIYYFYNNLYFASTLPTLVQIYNNAFLIILIFFLEQNVFIYKLKFTNLFT